jgi:PadR family transcriptional regulator, regulatory protein PadR
VVPASTGNERDVVKRRKYRKRVGVKMWESQLRKGSLALAVLATLRHGRLYGSEIRSRLEQIAGLTVTEGVIYPLLRRLGKTEFLETEWIDPAAGQSRRYFALTHRGHQYLAELSNTWSEFADGMDRMLAMPPMGHRQHPERDALNTARSEASSELPHQGAAPDVRLGNGAAMTHADPIRAKLVAFSAQ